MSEKICKELAGARGPRGWLLAGAALLSDEMMNQNKNKHLRATIAPDCFHSRPFVRLAFGRHVERANGHTNGEAHERAHTRVGITREPATSLALSLGGANR